MRQLEAWELMIEFSQLVAVRQLMCVGHRVLNAVQGIGYIVGGLQHQARILAGPMLRHLLLWLGRLCTEGEPHWHFRAKAAVLHRCIGHPKLPQVASSAHAFVFLCRPPALQAIPYANVAVLLYHSCACHA